jgi:hypothetical protein
MEESGAFDSSTSGGDDNNDNEDVDIKVDVVSQAGATVGFGKVDVGSDKDVMEDEEENELEENVETVGCEGVVEEEDDIGEEEGVVVVTGDCDIDVAEGEKVIGMSLSAPDASTMV